MLETEARYREMGQSSKNRGDLVLATLFDTLADMRKEIDGHDAALTQSFADGYKECQQNERMIHGYL